MPTGPKEIGDRLQFRSPVDAAGFTQASNCVLLDKEISDGAKVTYLVLRKHAWQEPSCFPGQKRLCDERGIKERALRYHLAELVTRGLITIEQRGNQKTNIYWIEPLDPVYGSDRQKIADRSWTGNFLPVHDRQKIAGPNKRTLEEDADLLEKDSETLNVRSGRDEYKSGWEAVERIVQLTGDTHSRRRFEQLYEITCEAGWGNLWKEAERCLQNRMARASSRPLEAPGAYFNTTLVRILEKRGIVVPVGSAEEREDVRQQIGTSLGLFESLKEDQMAQ